MTGIAGGQEANIDRGSFYAVCSDFIQRSSDLRFSRGST